MEALLASRLPDRAIVLGKVAAVAAYGWGVTLICWLAGWLCVRLAYDAAYATAMPDPAFVLAWPVVLSALAAALVACIGVLISLRAPSVRQAQQLMSVAMLATFLLVGLLAAELLNLGMGDKAAVVLTVSPPSWLYATPYCLQHC